MTEMGQIPSLATDWAKGSIAPNSSRSRDDERSAQIDPEAPKLPLVRSRQPGWPAETRPALRWAPP